MGQTFSCFCAGFAPIAPDLRFYLAFLPGGRLVVCGKNRQGILPISYIVEFRQCPASKVGSICGRNKCANLRHPEQKGHAPQARSRASTECHRGPAPAIQERGPNCLQAMLGGSSMAKGLIERETTGHRPRSVCNSIQNWRPLVSQPSCSTAEVDARE